jgi:hypothetical protein
MMAFSGADYANPDKFSLYREQIWKHIESVIDNNQLKTVRQAWIELEFNDPDSSSRLHSRQETFITSSDDQTDFRVLNLISKYPKLIDYRQTYTREPADPYLITYAQKWGAPIISDEKPLSQRTGTSKNRRMPIPDVCAQENIVCLNLETYLKSKGIIPPSYIP